MDLMVGAGARWAGGDTRQHRGRASRRRVRPRGPPHREITGAPTLPLAPGQQLVGAGDGAGVVFADDADGVRLSRDNLVSRLRLRVAPMRRAIYNACDDPAVTDLGTVRLEGVTATGQVQILAHDRVRAGNVVVDGLDVVAADVRDRAERPELLGVGALQGAFTLWNRQPSGDGGSSLTGSSLTGSSLTAELRGISVGRDGAPVRGSGVFVAGNLEIGVLETGAVYTDGGLPEGTHDRITGGVFVVHGAHVGSVRCRGPVTTYGVNDMALDNWGTVDTWVADAPVTTHGRSGVGFVNFGAIGSLRITAPIETHGVGARGFNVYRLDEHTGPTVDTAEFERIVTHADAAIGIQVGQPIGRLIVHSGIATHGRAGDSLVRGVLTRLSAHALSVQPGGRIESVEVGGALSSAGPGVAAVDVRGEVVTMRVAGGIHASGAGADALVVSGGSIGLHDTPVTAAYGAAVRVVAA